MTSLADNLLKSRSIVQLTSVVDNLTNEVLNKQKELQGMVGSQYNQFIRSADKIIDMKDRATCLINSLKDSLLCSSHVSDKFDELMQQNSLISVSKLEVAREHDISLAFLWESITIGNLYYPGKLIIAALFLNGKDFDASLHLKSHFVLFKSLSFLTQDLLEACEVVLASEQSKPNRLDVIGRTLLIYSVLQAAIRDKKRKSLDDFEWYINLAEVRIEKILSSMGTFNDPSTNITSCMFSLVSFLQDSVIDLYYLFLKRFDTNLVIDDHGLLSQYSRELENDVDCLIFSVATYAKLRDKFIELIHMEVLIQLVEERIKSWISTKFKQVMGFSSKILMELQDAHEVAKLQQMVHMFCSGDNRSQESILNYNGSNLYFIDAWREATAHIFGSHIRRSKMYSDPSEYVWISVFQVSFLQQVKRLLRINSSGIIQRVHSLIIGSLRKLGLEVEGGVIKITQKDGLERPLSSTAIYGLAESIRKNLIQHLSSLIDDVISPIENTSLHEPAKLLHNHDAKQQELIQAIRETFCGLYSTLLGILRDLLSKHLEVVKATIEVSTSAVYVHGEILQSFLKTFKVTGQGKGIFGTLRGVQAFDGPTARILRQSALFLGRLALSLKSESSVLHFNLLGGTPEQEKVSNRIDSSLVSEEQLKSTFEIADINGDGIISQEEAFEALSALSVYSFELSLHEERTFDYEEFLLMFGSRLLPPEEFVPMDLLNQSLDRLLSTSHLLWALIMVDSEVKLFCQALKKSFTLPSNQLSEISFREKIFWITRTGDPNDVSSYEDLPPLSCTTSLVTFLQKLSFEFSTVGISIDLFQCSQATNFRQQLFPFISILSHYFRVVTFASLLNAYEQQLLLFQQVENTLFEDRVLQGLFDLEVLSRCVTEQESNLQLGFSSLKEKYEALLDPVTSQIFLSHLFTEAEIVSKQLFSLTHLQSSQALRSVRLDEQASLPQYFSVEKALKQLLSPSTSPAGAAPPKFSFLPLALTTPAVADSSTWASKSSRQEAPPLVALTDHSKKIGSSNSIRWW